MRGGLSGVSLTATALAVFLLACARAPWRFWLIGHPDRQHVWLGSLVMLLLLGTRQTDIAHGLLAQPLFITTLTLMHGWMLALVGIGIVMAANCLQHGDWAMWPAHFLCAAVIPAVFIQGVQVVVARHLSRDFWVFIFVTVFGGTIGAFTLSSLALLAFTAPVPAGPDFSADYAVLLILMGFAEAYLNGLLMSVAVVYRPEWVCSTIRG